MILTDELFNEFKDWQRANRLPDAEYQGMTGVEADLKDLNRFMIEIKGIKLTPSPGTTTTDKNNQLSDIVSRVMAVSGIEPNTAADDGTEPFDPVQFVSDTLNAWNK